MALITLEIEGAEALLRKFGVLGSLDILEDPVKRGALLIAAALAVYPNEKENSSYVRGGPKSQKLGATWLGSTERTRRDGSDSILGIVGTNVTYAPWVQSERFQTAMHRETGWKTDQAVAQEKRAEIMRNFENQIANYLD